MKREFFWWRSSLNSRGCWTQSLICVAQCECGRGAWWTPAVSRGPAGPRVILEAHTRGCKLTPPPNQPPNQATPSARIIYWLRKHLKHVLEMAHNHAKRDSMAREVRRPGGVFFGTGLGKNLQGCLATMHLKILGIMFPNKTGRGLSRLFSMALEFDIFGAKSPFSCTTSYLS